ncbi:hypothetical protein ABH922_005347 [Rhodococcus sp. 27YEA15]|uniref:hypothetical protein n=1 Tax=Rhodococcus sp. 27YEA15 TaxID=3156259 RepID=UPI003C7CB2E7
MTSHEANPSARATGQVTARELQASVRPIANSVLEPIHTELGGAEEPRTSLCDGCGKSFDSAAPGTDRGATRRHGDFDGARKQRPILSTLFTNSAILPQFWTANAPVSATSE